ncbi:hypothetical protein ALI44B_04560 [Leifsonia sp. ALI-44-B]|uniref:hypothetical protein n=1 Tax=Leifsonia sp. ALI-44-B TaxID=1933776 RepID=UPI00097BB724|nr:hypothetical protein [Leifsonia sp. ALI-44-B]ONI63902.1 hypothetical protein ALI44B_04560 [Leifsonia sp. ALI-44-B]
MAVTFDSRAAEALTESITHLGAFEAAGVPLDVESCTLTFDEAQAPHALFRARCKVPTSQADLDALDPRLGKRMTVAMGYRYAGGTRDVQRMADLILDDRRVSRPQNTMELVGQSDERVLMDFGSGVTDTAIPTSAEAFSAIRSLIWASIPNAPTADDSTRATGWVGAEPIVIKAGDNSMAAILDIADRAGDLWVYDDGLRTWRITKRPTLVGKPKLALKVGVDGTIITAQTGVGRKDFANSVLVRHTWRDANKVDQVVQGYADVMSGPYSVGAIGRKLMVVERDYAGTTATAQAAARSLVRRAVSRGRSLTIEAIAAYWLRPGDTISIQLPTGPEELHLIAAVHFEQPSGLMTIETRQPDDITIQTGA